MFDFIRKHTKITMGLLFLLIVPSFVLLGLNDYGTREGNTTVAQVDGRDITQAEWDNAHRQEVDRLRAQMPGLDLKMLDTAEAKYSTLERLVRERVMAAAADQLHLAASNQRLANELQSNPQIAMLRKADGTLDMERYKQLLSSQGMTPEMFEASVRADMTTRQVIAGVVATGTASRAVADQALGAYFERRQVQLARFKPADYTAKLSPTDAELEQFHQAKASQFMAPEQASVQYLVLDAQTVSKRIEVSDADLKTYYEQNQQKLASKEERRASHILINAPKDAPAAEREAAKAKATELLAQARKAPDRFADLARKHSQDTGSATQGGDLSYFARGAMVKPFEEAVFGLSKGQVSDLVETEFGYHIIRVTDIKAPRQRSFEELKDELTADIKKQMLQKKFAEAAEQFSNAVYEQSDSLKPAADKLGLQIQSAEQLTRTGAAGAKGPLAHPKLLAALFSSDAIEKKRNTEAVDVGAGTLVSARIVQHTPARTLPLAEVRDQVKARWTAERSAELARQDGAKLLAQWQAKPDEAKLGEALTFSRAEAARVPTPLLNAALRADSAALPIFKGVDLGEDGYVIVKVTQVLPPQERAAQELEQARGQYTQWWTTAEGLAYYKLLQERLKVKFKVSKPAAQSEAKG
jgi:peptidyl-prolyl cis-trans isomerase D